MGNTGSRRTRTNNPPPLENQPPPSVEAAPYTNRSPLPFYQYHGYYSQPPVPSVYMHHQMRGYMGPVVPGNWSGGGAPEFRCGGVGAHATPLMAQEAAVTIRNDVNVKKDSFRLEPDKNHPGMFLVAFTFDATVPGSITIMFFAKEDPGFTHSVIKPNLLKAVTIPFGKGLGQKFSQLTGTGIDFSMFDEAELSKESSDEIYPLVVKAQASPLSLKNGEQESSHGNSQITQAVFEKEKGQYHVRVAKQILWVGKNRYELQEIYGIGNTVDGEYGENDSGKECVICLSEPRDITVLPCRHMCMCSGCAKVLRFQTDRCPICRQPVNKLLEIKVTNGPEV